MGEPWLVVATVWWIGFSAAVGLTLGSYLNVVVFRIPRGISTSNPRWSFCPGCESAIRWYDNLPVLSYLRLGGTCRTCGMAISQRYPIIELLTATAVLLLLDALFVAHLRQGLYPGYLGLTEQLWHDWPILLAHVVLFACFLAMSVIDLEHYFIDIRFTNFAVLAGFVLHALWSPDSSRSWVRPGTGTAVMAVVVALVLGITWLLLRLWWPVEAPPDQAAEAPQAPADTPVVEPLRTEGALGPHLEFGTGTSSLGPAGAPAGGNPEPAADPPAESSGPVVQYRAPGEGIPHARPSRAGLWLAVAVFVSVAGALIFDAVSPRAAAAPIWREMLPLIAFFGFILGGGAPSRASDTEIVEAIDAERTSARSVALQELLLLGPAIICGGLAVWLVATQNGFHDWAAGWLDWSPLRHGVWRPITGLATAAAGYVIGGAVGWGVRIVFTLLLGREAFGMGDIHLMAAAGCVAGWPVVVLGFVLTCFLALLGWVALLPFKRTRAIPLVPWLSLAFMVVVVYLGPISAWGPVANVVGMVQYLLGDKSQPF